MKGYLDQVLTYFDRPAIGVPIAGDVRAVDRTVVVEEDLAPAAATALEAVAGPPCDLDALDAADRRLDPVREAAGGWRDVLGDGGAVVVHGLPLGGPPDEVARVVWLVALLLGEPGAQNPAGEHLTHIRAEAGAAIDRDRLYRTAAEIAFHCDAADCVGLACVANGATGGDSLVASSEAVAGRLLGEAPELAARLFEPVFLDPRAEGVDPIQVVPCCWDGERVRTFFHADYFRSPGRCGARFEPDERAVEAFDAFERIATELAVPMRLAPGDLQLLSNHATVHARTAFDPATGERDLLRLWLTLRRPVSRTGRSSPFVHPPFDFDMATGQPASLGCATTWT